MYALLVPTLLISGYGFYLRYRLWRSGKPEQRFDHTLQRLKQVLIYGFGQRRVLENVFAGLFHILIFFAAGTGKYLPLCYFVYRDPGSHDS